MNFSTYIDLGGKGDVSTFQRFYPIAKAKLDYYTFGRIDETTGNAAICMVAIIDYLADRKDGIESFSNDGVSVSLEKSEEFENKLISLIRELLPIETYRGIL